VYEADGLALCIHSWQDWFMNSKLAELLKKRVAVFVSWQWRETELSLAQVQEICTQFVSPHGPQSIDYFLTDAVDIHNRSSKSFFKMLDEHEAKPFDLIVFLSADDLFLVSEDKIDFFTWILSIQRPGGEAYFIRDDLFSGEPLRDFLPKLRY
jgi:hypothetical protein